MDDITFIHTSDIHLGRKFNYLKDKAGDAREHLFEVLKKISDLAIEKKVKFIIIAGDLFDSTNPDLYSVGKFLNFVSVLAGQKIRVVVLPGTHDYLSENGIYSNKNLFNAYKNLFIFNDPIIRSVTFEDLSVTLYAYPPVANKMDKSPISGFNMDDDVSLYRIIIAHGSVQIPGKSDPKDSPITFEEIESSKASYIALGHWHQNLDFTRKVPCFYSGSPELIDIDQSESGFVMYGDLSKGIYESIKVGDRYFDELSIPLSNIHTPEQLVEKIISNANLNLIRKVVLIGKKPKEIVGINFDILKKELSANFYFLIIEDKSEFSIDKSIDYELLSPIEKSYISNLKDLIEKTQDNKEKEMYTEALEIGYALLNGRNDIL
jgi:exonuclease SbcD